MSLDTLTLDDIPVEAVHLAQQAAVVRLHLWTIAEIHEALAKVSDAARDILLSKAEGETVDVATGAAVTTAVNAAWNTFIETYSGLVGFTLTQAASLPFGVLAVLHNEWVRPVVNEEVVETRRVREQLNTSVLFDPQLRAIVNAAYRRTYEDGLNLSNRIWQLDRYGRDGLNHAINNAIARGDGAWELAQAIEQYLLPGRNCPRWARERLRDLTKADIAAGDRTGLYSGDDCRGQGVSYNALRLARTEIQAILNMATVENFRSMPWIEKEQINLSPEHAVLDECDDIVNGGEGGYGIYPIGDVYLPVHPHCLCYRTAVQMDHALFVGQLRGWMTGSSAWPQMDAYAMMLGGREYLGADLREARIGLSLAYWLWADPVELGGLFWNMALS
jgi:hypothetical protein